MSGTQRSTPEEGRTDSAVLSGQHADTRADEEGLAAESQARTIIQVMVAVLYVIFILVGFVWTGLIR